MKRLIKFILALSIALSLFAVGIGAENNKQELTMLFTHDMHDNLEPYTMEINNKVVERGGFARLYSAILQEKEVDPEALLVDGGDFSQGTLFQSIFTTHAPALHLMGMMGYDATTFGNHEFDFRPEGLALSLQSAIDSSEPVVDIVSANTNYDVENKSEALSHLETVTHDYPVTDYKIVEKNGLKVGIFGIMGYEADSNAPMAEVEFSDMIEASQRVTAELEDKGVDVIVALSHSGTHENEKLSEDQQLAKAVPAIDVILSAHSHTVLDVPIINGDTAIVSAGRYGQNLGKVVLESNNGRWKVKDYQIIPITDQFEEHPKIANKIEAYKKDVDQNYLNKYDLEYSEVVATSPFNFTPATKLSSTQEEEPLAHLIGDGYIHAVKEIEGENYQPVDVAVVPSGVLRESITQGDLSVRDAFKILPLGVGKDGISGYPLISVYLSGKELALAAEIDASISPILTFAKLYNTGMQYTYNPRRIILNKVTDVHLWDGKDTHTDIDNDQLYRVVTDLYTAQMLSVVNDKSLGLLSIVPKDINGNPIADFEDHIVYNNDQEELKVWVALTNYLKSFKPNEKGIPEIDMKYASQQGYKIIETDNGFLSIFTHLNKFSIAILSVILLIVLLVIFIIRLIIKKFNQKIKQNRLDS